MVHAIVDDHVQHPRWTFRLTPTSASWLNAVEGSLVNWRLKRWRIPIRRRLQVAIDRFIADANADPKALVWIAPPKAASSPLSNVGNKH
jgi:hypothetical protein